MICSPKWPRVRASIYYRGEKFILSLLVIHMDTPKPTDQSLQFAELGVKQVRAKLMDANSMRVWY